MTDFVKLARRSLDEANRTTHPEYINAYANRAIANLMMAEWERKHSYSPKDDTGPR